MVIHPDEGVIARVAGARGDPGTGVGATPLTGGSFARRPEIRRVEPGSGAEVRIDATLREVEFYREVQSSGPEIRSESSVLERSRGRRGARGRVEPVSRTQHAEFEREEPRKSETAAQVEARATALAAQLVVRVGTEQGEASEGVERRGVRCGLCRGVQRAPTAQCAHNLVIALIAAGLATIQHRLRFHLRDID